MVKLANVKGAAMAARLRGHAEAKIDDKGRLKMPSAFKKTLDSTHGNALFITALTDDFLQVYPLPVWEEIEARVTGLGFLNPARRRFLTRANRFGTEVEMDSQGRVALKPSQRDLVGITDDTVLIGCLDHIQIWPAERMGTEEDSGPLTTDDFETLEF
ncbi:MAG: hypothetical protein KDC35_04910 [Acidobacteria bacterium]|nr:hypothetical protein [Acidobacteriota bacterium]